MRLRLASCASRLGTLFASVRLTLFQTKLTLEHKPISFEKEIVEPEGSYENLVDVENNLLYSDSNLRIV